MKRSTFSPTQIAGILKEFDNGKGIDELTRMYANLAMELDVAKYIIEKKL